jgi:hypothetical protein
MTELERLRAQEAANDEPAPRVAGARQRERTVPIPQSLTPVPGYPQKLVVFKMAASRFWQMRCWMDGRSHRRSARTESLRLALHAARLFYEEMLARKHSQLPNAEAGPTAVAASAPPVTPSDRSVSFGHLAENLMRDERARAQRGEWSLGSWQVMRNRLDAALLPRWADVPVQQIDHQALLELSQDLSARFSITTVSQYLVSCARCSTMRWPAGC